MQGRPGPVGGARFSHVNCCHWPPSRALTPHSGRPYRSTPERGSRVHLTAGPPAGGRRSPAMVDTVPTHAAASAPLPDRSVVPPRVGPDHEPRRGPRRGLVARSRREGDRYLDYTSGIGVTNTGHAHPRVVAGDPGAGRASCSTASRTSSTTSPGCGSTSGWRGLLPGGPWRRVPRRTRAPRRSRPRSSSPGSRPAGPRSSRSATASTAGPPRRWR